jgi:hypothetical protein
VGPLAARPMGAWMWERVGAACAKAGDGGEQSRAEQRGVVVWKQREGEEGADGAQTPTPTPTPTQWSERVGEWVGERVNGWVSEWASGFGGFGGRSRE